MPDRNSPFTTRTFPDPTRPSGRTPADRRPRDRHRRSCGRPRPTGGDPRDANEIPPEVPNDLLRHPDEPTRTSSDPPGSSPPVWHPSRPSRTRRGGVSRLLRRSSNRRSGHRSRRRVRAKTGSRADRLDDRLGGRTPHTSRCGRRRTTRCGGHRPRRHGVGPTGRPGATPLEAACDVPSHSNSGLAPRRHARLLADLADRDHLRSARRKGGRAARRRGVPSSGTRRSASADRHRGLENAVLRDARDARDALARSASGRLAVPPRRVVARCGCRAHLANTRLHRPAGASLAPRRPDRRPRRMRSTAPAARRAGPTGPSRHPAPASLFELVPPLDLPDGVPA